MTYGEVLDTISAYVKKEKQRQKEVASNIYTLASLIKLGIGSLLGKDVQYPSINELYPGMFDEEIKKTQEQKAEQELIIWKQRMLDFAQYHNRKWGEKK